MWVVVLRSEVQEMATLNHVTFPHRFLIDSLFGKRFMTHRRMTKSLECRGWAYG